MNSTLSPTLRHSPSTVADYVTASIRDRILTGRCPLGSRLDQQTLAEELGVSVIPVREGLRQLEATGLVQIYPRRGVFVAQFSVDELREIYFIRQTLEEAATRAAVPNLSSQTLAHLASLIEQMEQVTAAQEFGKLLDINRSFHFAIYEGAHSPLMLKIISDLWDRCTLYRRLYTYQPPHAARSMMEHQELYAACKDGQAMVAGQLMREHLRQFAEDMLAEFHTSGGNKGE